MDSAKDKQKFWYGAAHGEAHGGRGLAVWHVAAKTSESSFLINYRVDDLDELLARLRRDDIPILEGPESHENGRFAWILDPDGNKLELWQPMLEGPE